MKFHIFWIWTCLVIYMYTHWNRHNTLIFWGAVLELSILAKDISSMWTAGVRDHTAAQTMNHHKLFEPEVQYTINFTEMCIEYCRIFDRVILYIYILYALMILMCPICCPLPKIHSASLCLSQRTREDNISCAPCVCQHSSNACFPF